LRTYLYGDVCIGDGKEGCDCRRRLRRTALAARLSDVAQMNLAHMTLALGGNTTALHSVQCVIGAARDWPTPVSG